jgi:hypothetical protein
MKKVFYIAFISQLVFGLMYFAHIYFYPLGSDFMFAVLLASIIAGIVLSFQLLKNKFLTSNEKITGFVFALMPLFYFLSMIYFVSGFDRY